MDFFFEILAIILTLSFGTLIFASLFHKRKTPLQDSFNKSHQDTNIY